jgi:hypothetical protein
MMPLISTKPDRKWSDQWTKEARQSARKLAAKAIRSGALTRQPCQVCGEPYAVAHHEDYDQPLAVEWLCRSHHVRRHNELDPTIMIRQRQAVARSRAKWKAWHQAIEQRCGIRSKARGIKGQAST